MFDIDQAIRLKSLSHPTANENMNKAAQYRPQVTTKTKVPGEGPQQNKLSSLYNFHFATFWKKSIGTKILRSNLLIQE
jgi:hypothetical protein